MQPQPPGDSAQRMQVHGENITAMEDSEERCWPICQILNIGTEVRALRRSACNTSESKRIPPRDRAVNNIVCECTY